MLTVFINEELCGWSCTLGCQQHSYLLQYFRYFTSGTLLQYRQTLTDSHLTFNMKSNVAAVKLKSLYLQKWTFTLKNCLVSPQRLQNFKEFSTDSLTQFNPVRTLTHESGSEGRKILIQTNNKINVCSYDQTVQSCGHWSEDTRFSPLRVTPV